MVVDITNKLKNEKAYIQIGEKKYEVKKDKNTVTEVMQKITNEKDTFKVMDIVVNMLLGEETKKEIDELNLSLADYTTLFTGVLAAATETPFEDMEDRFQFNK